MRKLQGISQIYELRMNSIPFHLYRSVIFMIYIYRLEAATNNGDVSWMEKDNPNYYINDMIKGKLKIQYSNGKS